MNLYKKDEVELNQVLFIKFMHNLYQLIIYLTNKKISENIQVKNFMTCGFDLNKLYKRCI